MQFRAVTYEDARFLFELRNQPSVRDYSFHSDPIQWEDHKGWLEKALENNNLRIFIILNDCNELVGMFRLEQKEPSLVIISIAIDELQRGNRYGFMAIKESIVICKQLFGAVTLRAYIKSENVISFKAFHKAGFQKNELFMEYHC